MVKSSNTYARPLYKPVLLIAGLIILSTVYVLLLSTSTSFFYSCKEQLDSMVYQVIGREWLSGVLPYRDLWDLKGPLVFFINALGFLLTDSRYGILIIQVIFLFVSLLLVSSYLKKRVSYLKSFVGCIIICCTLATVYEGGNMVEEYILPFLYLSFIFMNRWIEKIGEGNYEHKWSYGLVYGLTFAFALYTRLTNALPLCAGVAYIAIFLIYKRKWINLLCNMLAFIAGFLLIVIPFLIYFYLTDTILDYWASIIFCFKYLSLSNHTLDLKKLILFNFPIFLLMIVVIINYLYIKNLHKLFFWSIVSFVSLYWFINSRGYNHYSIIFLPYMVIALYEIAQLGKRWQVFLCLIVLLYIVRAVKHDLTYYNELDDVKKSNLIINEMMNTVPEPDRANTLIYCDIISPYLYQEICPSKYFYLQDENASISPYYKKMMLVDFYRVRPKYIITGSTADNIKGILDSYYSLLYEDSYAMVYKRLD